MLDPDESHEAKETLRTFSDSACPREAESWKRLTYYLSFFERLSVLYRAQGMDTWGRWYSENPTPVRAVGLFLRNYAYERQGRAPGYEHAAFEAVQTAVAPLQCPHLRAVPESRPRRESLRAGTIPSVVESLTGRVREWGAHAPCAEAPYSDWKWVLEPSGGRMTPAPTVRMFKAAPTLPSVVTASSAHFPTERRTVEGHWGGTTRPERTAALRQVASTMPDGAAITLWVPHPRRGVSSSLGKDGLHGVDHAELFERTADALEASFPARLGIVARQDSRGLLGAFPVPPRPRRSLLGALKGSFHASARAGQK